MTAAAAVLSAWFRALRLGLPRKQVKHGSSLLNFHAALGLIDRVNHPGPGGGAAWARRSSSGSRAERLAALTRSQEEHSGRLLGRASDASARLLMNSADMHIHSSRACMCR